jgi:hypothetical protein
VHLLNFFKYDNELLPSLTGNKKPWWTRRGRVFIKAMGEGTKVWNEEGLAHSISRIMSVSGRGHFKGTNIG